MKKAQKLKIMAASLALSMFGCTIVKNSNFSHMLEYRENSIITFDEVDPTGIFFHKTVHDKITLHDIILTNSERDIVETDSLFYKQIVASIEEDSFPIQQLHIEENLSSAFLAPSITNVIMTHKNHSTYNSESNDIIWDKVVEIWIKNSEERVKLDQQYCQFAHSQNLYLELSVLEKEKIIFLSKQMQEFIYEVRQQLPNLDMKRIACQLEEMSFCYSEHSYPNALLVSDHFTLIFPRSFGALLDVEIMKKDLFHEFKHILATPCDDEVKNQLYFPSQTGIYTILDPEAKEDKEKRNAYTWYYLPFDWLFLEEAGAETFSSELVQQLPTTYSLERRMQQDMLLGISVLPYFDKNVFVKSSLLHNPIALLQQFPIPDIGDQEQWLYQNAKMIECYNILSSNQAFLNYILNIEEVKGYEHIFKRQNGTFGKDAQKILLSLEDSADLQLFRIFLINMINCDKQLELNDYIYLYQLMNMRIQIHRSSIFHYYGITIEDTYYQKKQAELKQSLIHSLEEQFHQDVSLEEHIDELSNCFSNEERQYYRQLWQETITEPIIHDKISLEKVLNYYLGD